MNNNSGNNNRSSNLHNGSIGKTEYRLSISSNPNSRRSSIDHENMYTELSDTHSNSADYYDNNNGSNSSNNNDYDVLHKYLLPQINELHDSFITMENNYLKLNYIHNSLVDLNESFGSLLYGLIINSACYQFPNFPNNVGQQIDTINILNKLTDEKRELQEELQKLKTVPVKTDIASKNNKNININGINKNYNTNNKKFLSNMHPPTATIVNQGKRQTSNYRKANDATHLKNVQQYNNIRHTHTDIHNQDSHAINHNYENMEIDDDNSSEASFVMDPTIDTRRNRQYRRKSILNVIRNSINPRLEESSGAQLNGKARRVQTHAGGNTNGRGVATKSGAPRLSVGVALTGDAAAAHASRRNARRPTPISKRAPFR